MPAYMQHIINPVRILAFVLLVCAPGLSMGAIKGESAQVRIEGDSPSGRLTIHVENARLEDVLERLALKFGFEFKGVKNNGSRPNWSATLAASNLETLLSRLLRNRDHFIIRSGGANGSIRRVLLIAARSSAKQAPAQIRSHPAASTVRRKAVKPGAKPGYNRIKTSYRKTP